MYCILVYGGEIGTRSRVRKRNTDKTTANSEVMMMNTEMRDDDMEGCDEAKGRRKRDR